MGKNNISVIICKYETMNFEDKEICFLQPVVILSNHVFADGMQVKTQYQQEFILFD